MAKRVQSLTGEAKDAFLERAAASAGGGDVLEALKRDVTRVWVRIEALASGVPEAATDALPAEDAAAADDAFDPYTPNVIVVIRTKGREAALAALQRIAAPANLRLLAREQQLGIEAELSAADEIRQAIVAAAERRIANRRAAAS